MVYSTLTSKNFGPINFGHLFLDFGQNVRKFQTNFKSVQIISDNHSYSGISFLNENIFYFFLLMPIEILQTKGFHMGKVILQTRRFHKEGVLDIICSYILWVHMSGKQFEILPYVGGTLPKTYFCVDGTSVKIG
jgi:hypothetical protein